MMPSKHECAIDQIEDMYIKQCLENEALLKKVGKAIDHAEGVHSENWQETITTILHILKGG